MHLRTFLFALCAALFLAACSSAEDDSTAGDASDVPTDQIDDLPNGEPEPEPDIGAPDDDPVADDPEPEDEPEPEQPEAPEDPFAVPDDIDEEYVQAVMDELMRRRTEVLHGILERSPPSPLVEDDLDDLDALYAGPLLPETREVNRGLLLREADRESQLPLNESGTMGFDVMELYSVQPECITVLGWWDLTETAVQPFAEDLYAAFVLRRDESVNEDRNPTQWQFWDNGRITSGGDPVPPEEWDELEIGDALETDCGADA